MRKDKQQSSMFRRPSLTYKNREERERRNEDRKYVIVVTEIVDNSRSTEAHELVGDSIRAELPVLEETPVLASELPGNTKLSAVELPTIEARAQKHSAGPVCQIAELPADMPVQVAKPSSQRTDPNRQV